MTLYVALKNSDKYRSSIQAICAHAGINDYYILDPAHEDLSRGFRYLVTMGKDKPEVKGTKVWDIPCLPEKDLDIPTKRKIMEAFKMINKTLVFEKTKTTATAEELPNIKNLDDFVNEYKGSVVELRLEDRRLVGIYPDNQKLLNKYDIEYHVSMVVNMLRIKNIFNPTKIQIKEV